MCEIRQRLFFVLFLFTAADIASTVSEDLKEALQNDTKLGNFVLRVDVLSFSGRRKEGRRKERQRERERCQEGGGGEWRVRLSH